MVSPFKPGQGIMNSNYKERNHKFKKTIDGIKTSEILHVGIYGVITKEDSVLVVRKARGPYKGLFDLPGGRPLHGESLERALQREIAEETGIAILRFSFLGNFSFLTAYKEEGKAKELYHIALIYKIEEADLDDFNPSVIEEDVRGSLWLNQTNLDKKECSPLLNKVLCL